jgi:BMFP domain-containing protein YqiC
MAKESIDKLARTLAESVPGTLRSVGDDLQKNFRAILEAGVARLDLVTREEFDVQQAVLARTREKLEALEGRLAAVEAKKAAKKQPAKKKPAGKKTANKKASGGKTARKKAAKKKPS